MAQATWWQPIIRWSRPISISDLKADLDVLPEAHGFYAFTADTGSLKVDKVLYIGETGQQRGLRGRLPSYLIDYRVKKPPGTKSHKGRDFILYHRASVAKNDKSVFVRWSQFEGDRILRLDIEVAMIQFYRPLYNDKYSFSREVDYGPEDMVG